MHIEAEFASASVVGDSHLPRWMMCMERAECGWDLHGGSKGSSLLGGSWCHAESTRATSAQLFAIQGSCEHGIECGNRHDT